MKTTGAQCTFGVMSWRSARTTHAGTTTWALPWRIKDGSMRPSCTTRRRSSWTPVSLRGTGMGDALARQGKFAEAIVHYSQALKLDPNNAEAQNNLRVALVGQGNIADAIVHYSPSSAEAHRNLGDVLASQGKFDEAISHYSESLRLNPASALTHRQLGVLLAEQGTLKESIAHFSEVVRLEPSAQAHYNLGFALVHDGKVTK